MVFHCFIQYIVRTSITPDEKNYKINSFFNINYFLVNTLNSSFSINYIDRKKY